MVSGPPLARFFDRRVANAQRTNRPAIQYLVFLPPHQLRASLYLYLSKHTSHVIERILRPIATLKGKRRASDDSIYSENRSPAKRICTRNAEVIVVDDEDCNDSANDAPKTQGGRIAPAKPPSSNQGQSDPSDVKVLKVFRVKASSMKSAPTLSWPAHLLMIITERRNTRSSISH